jgi:hypothetical protein
MRHHGAVATRLPAVRLAIVGHGLLGHARLSGRDPLGKRGGSAAVIPRPTPARRRVAAPPHSTIRLQTCVTMAARHSESVMHTETPGMCTASFE